MLYLWDVLKHVGTNDMVEENLDKIKQDFKALGGMSEEDRSPSDLLLYLANKR